MIELNGGKAKDSDFELVKSLLVKNDGFGLRMSEIKEQIGLKRYRLEKVLKKLSYIIERGVRYYFIKKEKK